MPQRRCYSLTHQLNNGRWRALASVGFLYVTLTLTLQDAQLGVAAGPVIGLFSSLGPAPVALPVRSRQPGVW